MRHRRWPILTPGFQASVALASKSMAGEHLQAASPSIYLTAYSQAMGIVK
jgi:hypothetical protein